MTLPASLQLPNRFLPRCSGTREFLAPSATTCRKPRVDVPWALACRAKPRLLAESLPPGRAITRSKRSFGKCLDDQNADVLRSKVKERSRGPRRHATARETPPLARVCRGREAPPGVSGVASPPYSCALCLWKHVFVLLQTKMLLQA